MRQKVGGNEKGEMKKVVKFLAIQIWYNTAKTFQVKFRFMVIIFYKYSLSRLYVPEIWPHLQE